LESLLRQTRWERSAAWAKRSVSRKRAARRVIGMKRAGVRRRSACAYLRFRR
jgi:hypothetical protein